MSVPSDRYSIIRLVFWHVLQKMVYSLELRIFLLLQFDHLNHSFVVTRRSFQRKFNVRNEPTKSTMKTLFEKLQRTGRVSGDMSAPNCSSYGGESLRKVIQQPPRISIRRVQIL
ncbi:hypothetical protein TNIN_277351 [Trichonephila inaurata madagascariensis]|uniref:DUF4817 domain-containing protein n=1 Tax=Trichonephila inaurata madagascariensis TaxID=2747483 RepID=A0A8X6M946_9ARAC|nr:hypothetical protein TNIN_277351 [Trichonephila inaurata madagascariensis]